MEKRSGKFAKLKLGGIRIKQGDRITVEVSNNPEVSEIVKAVVTEVSDNEKGGTEIFWEEL